MNSILSLAAAVLALGSCPVLHAAEIKVDTMRAVRQVDRHMFLGTNIAIWNSADTFKDGRIAALFRDIAPGIIRMPGGGMSDIYFWNGNGVRRGNNTPDAVDRSKYRNGVWQIDYSEWAPGFNGFEGYPKDPATAKLGTWHGNCDVKDLHDFIRTVNAQHMVTVNAGTGTPRDAAEWVKWANAQMGYGARFWEIGNELDQAGEAGAVRPDGRVMDGKVYAELFLAFARAIRKADPTAKIGGPAGYGSPDGFIPDLLKIAGDEVDFISYHDYYTVGPGTAEEMFSKLPTIKETARQIREMVRQYAPERAAEILIGLTEWNVKLHADVDTANLFSGIWTACALGEMLGSELDYACRWDGFTQNPDYGGGHGFILEREANPKAPYWAFYMVSNYFGDEILDAASSSADLRAYASRDRDGRICLMAVNTSPTEDVVGTIDLNGFEIPAWCECFRLSTTEYRWDPLAFNTFWNAGPSRSVLRAGANKEFAFPAYSVTILRFPGAATGAAGSLHVLGAEVGTYVAGTGSQLSVLVLDKDGKPMAGQAVTARFQNGKFTLDESRAQTSADGVATFGLRAPAGRADDRLVLSSAGLSSEYPVQAVQPEVRLVLPEKAPDDEPVTAEIHVLRGGGRAEPLAGFDGDFVLTGPTGATRGAIKGGLASVDLGTLKSGRHTYKADVPSLGVSSNEEVLSVYGPVERAKVVLTFDSDADLEHVTGKGESEIDTGVRAGGGVLALKMKDYAGWASGYLDFVKLNGIEGMDRGKVIAVTVQMKLGDDYVNSGSWAHMAFVLMSEANYWMQLAEVPIATEKKGEWVTIRMDVDKADWRKAMAGLFRIVVVYNSDGEQNGTVYLDNLGVIEKAEP